MKYVEWVQVVADVYASNPGGSHELVGSNQIAQRMGIGPGDPRDEALAHALDDLRGINALEFDDYEWIKPTAATWQIRDGVRLQTGWARLAAGPLNDEREAVLTAAVRLSEARHEDWADMTWTTAEAIRFELGWSGEEHDLTFITADLERAGR